MAGVTKQLVPATVDPAVFRDVMASFPTGVTIVTTRDDTGEPLGFTANSFCSVSLEPPLILVCLGVSANCFPAFARCRRFAISILRPMHAVLARRFASRGTDKFAPGGFRTTDSGLAVVDDALAVLECRVHERHPAGDHIILVGEVVDASTHRGAPLVFVQRSFNEVAGEAL